MDFKPENQKTLFLPKPDKRVHLQRIIVDVNRKKENTKIKGFLFQVKAVGFSAL
jgi:hypothetical protein